MEIGRIVICICLLFTEWMKSTSSKYVEQVQVLFRNGERTPVLPELEWLRKPNISLFEPYGLGQLTNRGIMQMYNLGRILRSRYFRLLGPMYRPGDVYARSSDHDCTKTSLQAVLAGLYPPALPLMWNNNLNWMPIPIETSPVELDNLFFLTRCPRYQKLIEDLIYSGAMNLRVETYERLMNKLNLVNQKFRYDQRKTLLLKNLIEIYDNMNISLPKWLKPRDREEIFSAAKLHLFALTFSQEMIKLSGGGFAKRFIENMNLNERSEKQMSAIYLYSGHEFTLSAVLKAHGIILPEAQFFGSAIILEKIRSFKDGKIFIKMFYFAGNTLSLSPVILPCGEECPIDQYLRILDPILPSNDDMECLAQNLKREQIL